MSRSTDPAVRRRVASALFAGAVATASMPVASLTATAAPRVEAFDAEVWTRLQATLPRPAVVVFTTTFCATCPEVFDGLRQEIRERRLAAPLVAVVLDGESLPRTRHDAHLRGADRLFAFRGQEAPLRFAVDPAWRGVTPYVALLGADGTVRFAAGTPTRERLDAWAVGTVGTPPPSGSMPRR